MMFSLSTRAAALRRTALMVMAGAAAFSCGTAMAATRYAFTDLGTLGGLSSFGYGVNSAGQVAVSSTTSAGNVQAARYANGTLTNLGSLGGNTAFAYALNSTGVVVGQATTATGAIRGFIDTGSGMADIGTLDGGSTMAYAVNASNMVTGSSEVGGHDIAYRWSGGAMTALGTLGGSTSIGHGINDTGTIVGEASTANDAAYRAVLWGNGGAVDLGTLGGDNSLASAINGAGLVVGRAETADGDVHAFAWSNGQMTNLDGVLGSTSEAYAVNSFGNVVGARTIGSVQNAFLYTGNTMVNLNDLVDDLNGRILLSANGIADNGLISGYALVGGNVRGYLLTPAGSVPEPASWGMMIGGLALTGAAMRRRRRRLAIG